MRTVVSPGGVRASGAKKEACQLGQAVTPKAKSTSPAIMGRAVAGEKTGSVDSSRPLWAPTTLPTGPLPIARRTADDHSAELQPKTASHRAKGGAR